MKILTNHPGHAESTTWKRYTEYVPVEDSTIKSLLSNAFKMFRKQKHIDCNVLGAGRADLIFLLFNTIVPINKKKNILIDCLWYQSGNKYNHMLKKILFKIIDLSVDAYVVWASREIEAYSRAFGLPIRKFKFIPYHHTINREQIYSANSDFIFSGGNFGRDYKTLIEAVRELDVKLVIASTRPEIFDGIEVPNNVIIQGFSHSAYLEKMSKCLINIVALAPNLLHSGGQQTFLNSMYFGKPTIVLDPEGASDYIVDGKDGILVEPGNPTKLKDAISYLLENPKKAKEIGRKARRKALLHSTENHFQKIVKLAEEVCRDT